MKANEFIESKNNDYGIYDNETGLRVIGALLQSSGIKPISKKEKTKLTLIDNELEKIQQYNERTQRQRLLKAYPQAYLKGTARNDYLDAKYNTQDRKRNEDLILEDVYKKFGRDPRFRRWIAPVHDTRFDNT